MRKEVVVASATAAATVLAAAALLRQLKQRKDRKWKQTQDILRKFSRECATPVPKLWEIANALVSDIEASLSSKQINTTLNVLVSYIGSLPTGGEEGVYYGINLRATNFLIMCARLGGKNEPITDIHREEIPIPSNVMAATSQELFDFIAVELRNFVSAHPDKGENNTLENTERKLGFIISYPVDQAVVSSGSAIRWNKSSADDTVGKGLVIQINQALEKHGVDLRVSTMVDDTIGDLAGGRYYNRDCVAAVTLGMGTNAAYVESPEAVPKLLNPPPNSSELVVSLNWGDFSTPHLPITEFDACLDAESSNPGHRIFEKLISGMYLGESVRRVLLKMAQETALFGHTVPLELATPYQLRAPDIAAMHQDTSNDHEVVSEKLKEVFGITNSTPSAREVVTEVCDVVAERGARLAGAAIVGIIKKLGRIENRRNVVAVEGGLYEHYRVFRNYLNSSVWEMLGNHLSDNVVIEIAHGGSGTGAVYLAASPINNNVGS